MDRVIVPKVNVEANCETPKCASCELSRENLKKPTVVKS
jgi:hypothetical protein